MTSKGPRSMIKNATKFSPIRSSIVQRTGAILDELDITKDQSSMSQMRKSKQHESMINFDAKKYILPGLSEKDVEQLKEVFDTYDLDKNGLLAPNELRTALINAGFKCTKETIYDIIAEVDDDEKGGLAFTEFLKLMVRGPPGNYETKDEIAKVFKKFDKKHKGYITIGDLREVAKELHEDVDEDILQEIIARTDSNKDGKISFEDFFNVMTKRIYT